VRDDEPKIAPQPSPRADKPRVFALRHQLAAARRFG
jgi:hypothetical protein